MTQPPIRILLLGDSGTGKTTFLRLLCENSNNIRPFSAQHPDDTDHHELHDHVDTQHSSQMVLDARKPPSSTCGCEIQVVNYPFRKDPASSHQTVSLSHTRHAEDSGVDGVEWHTLEFRDVGGSQFFLPTRSVFYNCEFDGVMLFYDTSNETSRQNLTFWLYELSTRCAEPLHRWFFKNDIRRDSLTVQTSQTYPSNKARRFTIEDEASAFELDLENPSPSQAVCHGHIPVVCVANIRNPSQLQMKNSLYQKSGNSSKTTRASKFPNRYSFIGNLFGAGASFVEKFVENQIPPTERVRLQRATCRILDSARTIRTNPMDNIIDTVELSKFLEEARRYNLQNCIN